MTKAAVFDLDGVLLDSMGIWNDLGARYLRSLGVTPEEGLNEILFSMSMEQGAEYLHTHYALPQSAAEVGAGIADMLRDFYFYEVPAKDGAGKWFKGRRVDNPNTHGTGCTLSSAIASNLAKGYDLDTSVERAKAYISGALAAMLDLGHGSGPMNHMFALKGDFVE